MLSTYVTSDYQHSRVAQCRRNPKYRSYYRVNSKCEVDETLFGVPVGVRVREKRLQQKYADQCKDTAACCSALECPVKAGQFVEEPQKHRTLFHCGHVRKIRMSHEFPTKPKPVILSGDEFRRIHNEAASISNQEIAAAKVNMEKCAAEKAKEVENRKQFFCAMNQRRCCNNPATLARLERENDVRIKANRDRLKQDPDVRKFESLLSRACVDTIRDRQREERRRIQQIEREEHRRLDGILEVEGKNHDAVHDAIVQKRKEEAQVAAAGLICQIQEKNRARLDAEFKKEEENQRIRRQLRRQIEEDKLARQKEKTIKFQYSQELRRENCLIREQQKQRLLEEQLLDAQLIEYQRARERESIERDRCVEEARREEEKRLARLRKQLIEGKKKKQQFEDLRLRRAEEVQERKWLQWELNQEKRKACNKQELQNFMREHRELRRRQKAVEAAEDRRYAEQATRKLLEEIDLDRQKLEASRAARRKAAEDMRIQVLQQEARRKAALNAEQCARKRDERVDEQKRCELLENYKRDRIQQLRCTGRASSRYLDWAFMRANMSERMSDDLTVHGGAAFHRNTKVAQKAAA